MSDDKGAGAPSESPPPYEEGEGNDTDYIPPAPKALNDIVNADAEDEALQRYKAALLGNAASGDGQAIVAFPDDARQVIVTKLW